MYGCRCLTPNVVSKEGAEAISFFPSNFLYNFPISKLNPLSGRISISTFESARALAIFFISL
jgi:hypothetical protein